MYTSKVSYSSLSIVLVSFHLIHSCSSEGLNRLCRECDRVFHKAATKRSHLRIPVVSHVMILNKLLSTLDSELHQVLQSMNQQHSSMIRSPCGIEYLYNTLCLLLYHFRTLMDDKRVRDYLSFRY